MATNNSTASTISCVPSNQSDLVIIYAIQGIYGGISILLYILNIRALLQQRNPLDRVFSKLYIASAIISIIYFLAHYCIQRFVGLGFWCNELLYAFGKPNWVLNPYKSIATYCPMAILVLHFTISFNRFTAVFAPFTAADFWSHHYTRILILSLLVPLIFTWFVLPCRSYAQVDKEKGGLVIEYERVFALSASLHSAIAAAIFGLLTFLVTIFIFIKLLNTNLKRISAAEKTMLAFEGFLAFTTLMYATTQALLYSSKYFFKSETMQNSVMFFRDFIIDIFILPNAWTLPLLSQSVRRFYVRTFYWIIGKKVSVQQPLTVTQRLHCATRHNS
uniref:Serpentine receptor class gamma n=1 Tax=Haemonchus contortus TaxID=6289 RepID=A0A7I4Y3R0_HAECO